MKHTNVARQHWAAVRALLALTLITGFGYPLLIWVIAQLPGLRDNADGSVVTASGKPVGSSLIGQTFADADGIPLPRYFQSRPSAAGYNPMASGASNLGPESILDAPGKPSLLTQVCARSAAVGALDGVSGARPYCTGDGVGAVLAVIGGPDPSRVVSVNEPCADTPTPFLDTYQGVRVECARAGEDYAIGRLVPIAGTAGPPAVPADAVTASGSGLDPDISVAYADLQINRVAAARAVDPDAVRRIVAAHTSGRGLGFLGEPRVNVLAVNLALDAAYPGG